MAPGEKYALDRRRRRTYEPTYDAQYLSKVDYDLWLGPAPKRPFNRNRFHYNWHWHWDYGNGDTGNQGPHQFDIARWGLGKQEHPVKISSIGGYFGAESSQETPDMQTALYEYADGTILEFGTRGELHQRRRQRSGSATCSTARRAGSGSTRPAASGSRTWARREEREGPRRRTPPEAPAPSRSGLTTTEFPHYQNFIDAIRAERSEDADLRHPRRAPVVDAAAPRRTSRTASATRCVFDGKTETFVDDKKADALLTREYRKGFEIPKSFS